jgi:hypothetical protein
LDPASSNLVSFSNDTLTLKTSGLSEKVTLYINGVFTQNTSTLNNDVRIRATNLDSEIVFIGNTLTLYPSSIDRDLGLNPGPSSQTGILRFKFGSTVSGVLLSGNQYSRIDVGTVSFSNFTLNNGYTFVDLGTSALLQVIAAKIDTKPTLAEIENTSVLAKQINLTSVENITNATYFDIGQLGKGQ